jgi:hypothetical protein
MKIDEPEHRKRFMKIRAAVADFYEDKKWKPASSMEQETESEKPMCHQGGNNNQYNLWD